MPRKNMTLADLAARGRRYVVLTHVAQQGGSVETSAVIRAMTPPAERTDAERNRVRSALRSLRFAGWLETDDYGWRMTQAGRDALAAVDADQPRAAA